MSSLFSHHHKDNHPGSAMLTVKDGTKIFYKDWGTGPAVVLSHGAPLSSDDWDPQMIFLASKGYRVVAHDRRGHGRSSQPYDGHNMDQYADDLSEVIEHLNLKNVVLIGHSTGGGEITRYMGRHGTKRVAKAVLISSVPPHLAAGVPKEFFDYQRASILKDRSQVGILSYISHQYIIQSLLRSSTAVWIDNFIFFSSLSLRRTRFDFCLSRKEEKTRVSDFFRSWPAKNAVDCFCTFFFPMTNLVQKGHGKRKNEWL